jgi:exodeoxyribonuclease V alpha subunit
MIDIWLFSKLLSAVPEKASLIFIGDIDQLPSVGPGNVLKDLISSGVTAVCKLEHIYRQAEKSKIVVNAHRIHKGLMPIINNREKTDFYFIENQEPEHVVNIIVEIVKKRIPAKFGFDPFNEIQVLCPMNKGSTGVHNLNHVLQKELNNAKDELVRGSKMFKTGDKIMQTKNNYDKNIFNGDVGFIEKILGFDQKVYINYDGKIVMYDFTDLDEISLAYAMSIHKSQGSEYPCIIIPLLTQHYMMLQRNLLYTGITRGKKLVNIVGTKKALSIAVGNAKIQDRNSLLKWRLTN